MERAKDTIQQTLSQVKAFLAQEGPPKLSEADTKANFIEPIIAALGWIGIGVVTREYYVRNSQEFIDYVMAGPSGPLLAIESKSLQTDLTDKAAAQLIQYCSVEGIEWAALTNGRELQFFNTFLKPDLSAKRFLSLDLLAFNSDEEYAAVFHQLWRLSRESMTTPAGLRTWLNQKRLDAALRAILLNPDSSSIRHLRKALADAEIKASSQELAQWFRNHLGAPITALPDPTRRISTTITTAPKRSANHDAPTALDASLSEAFGGANRELLPLLDVLQQKVNGLFAETKWRVLKYYIAAECAGKTFMAVKCRHRALVLGLTLPPETAHPRVSPNAGEFNWARMTKTVRVLNEAGLDDTLLELIGQARTYASTSVQGKPYYGVSLRQLIEAGLLQAGTTLQLVGSGKRDVGTATLNSDGEIVWQGRAYTSPSDRAFGPLLGRTSFNGWIHWFAELPNGRESLANVRARLLSSSSDAHGNHETVG